MKAELKKENGKFVVEVDGEVVISVSHRTNLIKNFRNNKKVISAGVTDLVEDDRLIYSLDPSHEVERARKTTKVGKKLEKTFPTLEGKYKDVLEELLGKKEFKHSELLNKTGLSRPNTELQRELKKLEDHLIKVNLGIGKGIIYRVK